MFDQSIRIFKDNEHKKVLGVYNIPGSAFIVVHIGFPGPEDIYNRRINVEDYTVEDDYTAVDYLKVFEVNKPNTFTEIAEFSFPHRTVKGPDNSDVVEKILNITPLSTENILIYIAPTPVGERYALSGATKTFLLKLTTSSSPELKLEKEIPPTLPMSFKVLSTHVAFGEEDYKLYNTTTLEQIYIKEPVQEEKSPTSRSLKSIVITQDGTLVRTVERRCDNIRCDNPMCSHPHFIQTFSYNEAQSAYVPDKEQHNSSFLQKMGYYKMISCSKENSRIIFYGTSLYQGRKSGMSEGERLEPRSDRDPIDVIYYYDLKTKTLECKRIVPATSSMDAIKRCVPLASTKFTPYCEESITNRIIDKMKIRYSESIIGSQGDLYQLTEPAGWNPALISHIDYMTAELNLINSIDFYTNDLFRERREKFGDQVIFHVMPNHIFILVDNNRGTLSLHSPYPSPPTVNAIETSTHLPPPLVGLICSYVTEFSVFSRKEEIESKTPEAESKNCVKPM